MKKLIWIDVGTHFGQEYNSIFGSNYNFYLYLINRFLSNKILKRGKFITLSELQGLLNARRIIRGHKAEFFTVFVEANPKIISKSSIYLSADIVYNIALIDNDQTPLSMTKLYLGDGDPLSQGSSVYLEKKNVGESKFVVTIGVSVDIFFDQLKLYIDEIYDDYKIILRLNCEGVEDNVIYAIHKVFNNNLKLICGSLKDVKDVKGKKKYNDLKKFLDEKELPFVFFSSVIDSWPKAHQSILNLLKE